MKKAFMLEGERITLHHAKELFGERYLKVLADAKEVYLHTPSHAARAVDFVERALLQLGQFAAGELCFQT